MIKVMNLVAILAAPFTTTEISNLSATRIGVVILSVVMLSLAVILSKRGSIAEDQGQAGSQKQAA
jgi:hypothetical protein